MATKNDDIPDDLMIWPDNEKDHDDHPKDQCGVFGIFDNDDACHNTIIGLLTLQHRGQESTGVVTWDEGKFHTHKSPKSVSRAFHLNDETKQRELPGRMAIGHVRYSTMGGSDYNNIQPFLMNTAIGSISIAHNGQLTNGKALREKLLSTGHSFQSTSDTEVILQLMASCKEPDFESRIIKATKKLEGAYSLVFLYENCLIGLRDPAGMRPLVLGKLGNSYVLSSETCAFDLIGAEYVRDIEPGEMIKITPEGIESTFLAQKKKLALCVFEYIYFMRPNSDFAGYNIAEIREKIGMQMAKESHIDADLISPVPDSGINAATGYAMEAGLPYRQSIIRSHFAGRSFIQPTTASRDFTTKLKLTVNKSIVKDKRVVLVDDSIVRGTTMPRLVRMLRQAGAKEVHVRISSPPFKHPCFYGIDTPSRSSLAAAIHSPDSLREMVGADTLSFISIEGLYKAFELIKNDKHFCDACFSGEYPIPIIDDEMKQQAQL